MEALIKISFLGLVFLGLMLFFLGEVIGMIIKYTGLILAIVFAIVFLVMVCF